MNLYSIKKYIITISLFIFLFPILSAKSATIELVLENNIFSINDQVIVSVIIDSEGKNINAAQATVFFPTNLFEVTKIDYNNSIFSNWLEYPNYDNTKGKINFVGGSVSGFSGSNLKVLKIYFKIKSLGSGRIGVINSIITASDGKGTNVFGVAKGLDITIPTNTNFESFVLGEGTQIKQLPNLLGLEVPLYPDPGVWNANSASFKAKWSISSSTIAAAFAINQKLDFIPIESKDAMIGSKIIPSLSDGVWYLHLRVKNKVGWSPTLHYRIALDTTPPNSFKIVSNRGFITNDARPTISYLSSDLTSGINNYIIRIDGIISTTTSNSSYTFAPLLPGDHKIDISAVDGAGNSTSEIYDLKILPIKSPMITYFSHEVIADEGNIVAAGTAGLGNSLIIQIQNSQKQIVAEQMTLVDDRGMWNILINKTFSNGEYFIIATSRDKNMSSSFPVISDVIKVKTKPLLILGGIEITQTSFFIGLIIILLVTFFAGWFAYRKWLGRLDKRVIIAQRDVMNFLNNTIVSIDILINKIVPEDLKKINILEIKENLKVIKENFKKTGKYIIDNIKEIEK